MIFHQRDKHRGAKGITFRSASKSRSQGPDELLSCFLPGPKVSPIRPLAISALLKALKVSSMIAVNQGRREAGEFWQGRFFDRALRTVKEYLETVEYIQESRAAWPGSACGGMERVERP